MECKILKENPIETLKTEDRLHPIFSAVGCLRLMEMKNSDRYLFSTLGNLERKIERVKEDHDTSQNLEEVKKILSKYNYQERDIEESYCLLKLYGYTLPDVEDSKVSKIL